MGAEVGAAGAAGGGGGGGPDIRRLLLAITLMMAVVVGTNLLFGPGPEPNAPETTGDPGAVPGSAGDAAADAVRVPGEAAPGDFSFEGADDPPGAEPSPEPADSIAERLVQVETPLFRITLSNYGATVRSVELLRYRSFAEDGPAQLVPPGARQVLGGLWAYGTGADTVSLSRFPFSVTPSDGLRLGTADGAGAGSDSASLVFRYDHPSGQFFSEIRYTFTVDSYMVRVDGRLPQLPAPDRTTLVVDMAPGLAVNELRAAEDRRMTAFSGNHLDDGIRARPLERVDSPERIDGPLLWAAVKSKFFLHAVLPLRGGGSGGTGTTPSFLAGLSVRPGAPGTVPSIRVATPVSPSGAYAYRTYLGPMERERLVNAGDELEEVNPYGWRFFRPIVRPFVGIVIWLMNYLHETLLLSYGWVLIVIGLLMRILMWPLYQKSMRAQVKGMAVTPLLQELQRKYADDREKLQRETLKLYKEHGVNPMAGCLPMLLPWPVLIALFFVFQNTIQLRGEPFLWLPDLSAPDPFYALPLFLGASMFLLQFISMRAAGTANPQMKMLMYIMPPLMTFIFWNFASGLNLYYSVVNIATIPQQVLIAKQRKKAMATGPGLRKPGVGAPKS